MDGLYNAKELLAITRKSLREIGYQDHLIREDYPFADVLEESEPTRYIPIAAFAQEPSSYRTACFGITVFHGQEASSIQQYRSLGAPQILVLNPDADEVQRWRMPAQGEPVLIERIDASQLAEVFQSRKDEWNPEQVLRAKSIGFARGPVQLDFFDSGLIPALEGVVQQKLDTLLQDVIATAKTLYFEQHNQEPNYEELFRLIFRFVAAKMLADRGFPGDVWADSDPQPVIEAIEQFYFSKTPAESVLQDYVVQQAVWKKIRNAFLFRNLSVEALAYVYENTLVSDSVRQQLDTHATPPEIAEYIIQRLPFEDLAAHERRVFEPFSGHAPFLIGAMGRLRTLLPQDMGNEERHAYFVQMLSGMEIDTFAREIARYSLILADYPNSDGWDIVGADVFRSPDFTSYVQHAQIVVSNPPFGDFDIQSRSNTDSHRAANKAVEALRRVLQNPPKLLGFVLPRVFMSGQSYREIRRQLGAIYNQIDLVVLPETAFQHSRIETVLLIASATQPSPRRTASLVNRRDYANFLQTGIPTWTQFIEPSAVDRNDEPVFWQTPLQKVWEALEDLPRFDTVATIHRGIEYRLPMKTHESQLISDHVKEGFVPGLARGREGFEPFDIASFQYLNNDPSVMLYEAYKLPWDKPKVIANAARSSRGPWTIMAVVDTTGLRCYQRFHGIWPKKDIPLEVIAAVLNGPVANAFISDNRTSRDNQIEFIKQVPFPLFSHAQSQSVIDLVNQYRIVRGQWRMNLKQPRELEEECRHLIEQIDAVILGSYNLTPRLERVLLDHFAGYERPGPVPFDRYYPPDFRPTVPWKMYISETYRSASARNTLKRLPIFDDPALSEVVREFDE